MSDTAHLILCIVLIVITFTCIGTAIFLIATNEKREERKEKLREKNEKHEERK